MALDRDEKRPFEFELEFESGWLWLNLWLEDGVNWGFNLMMMESIFQIRQNEEFILMNQKLFFRICQLSVVKKVDDIVGQRTLKILAKFKEF